MFRANITKYFSHATHRRRKYAWLVFNGILTQCLLCGFVPLVDAGFCKDLVDSAIVATDDEGLIDLLVPRADDGVCIPFT